MLACERCCCGVAVLTFALLATTVFSSGCHKKVKAEFERPPASASVPEAPPTTEPTPSPESAPGTEANAEPSPEQPASEPARSRPSRSRPSPPPASPPESPPPRPPPSPSLPSASEGVEAEEVRRKVERAAGILSTVQGRALGEEQRNQAEAARSFVSQAREALQAGDVRRASVLAEKGLILAEDLGRSLR